MIPSWTDVVSALGTALTPIVVVVFGVVIAKRQSISDHLIEVRLDYYKALIPDLNRLMCYLTFIGTWRDDSPTEVVELKRRLDATFFAAAPLFAPEVARAYEALMALSFRTFGMWGEDARIMSSPYRRKPAWRRSDVKWHDDWDSMFALGAEESISPVSLTKYRMTYDDLLARLVENMSLSKARTDYTTTLVSLNAGAPVPRKVE